MNTPRWIHVLLGVALMGASAASTDEPLPVLEGVGGDFSADSTLGKEVSLSDYKDKVVLLSFGYTSCQDVCPATMGLLHTLMSKLESDASSAQVLFATVDPETDTVEHLTEYLGRFDPRFVGLTGTQAEVTAIAKLFMAKHDPSHDQKVTTDHHKAKTFTDESFLYAHSQQIYLIDGRGRTRALYFTGTPLDQMVKDVRSLLESEKSL